MEVRFFFSVTVFIATAATITESQEGALNAYCSESTPCGKFGYVCRPNKTCQCDNSYIPSTSKEKCVGGVGQECKYDEHCIEGAFCEHQSKCQCKEDLYPYEDGLVCSTSSEKYHIRHDGISVYLISAILTFLLI